MEAEELIGTEECIKHYVSSAINIFNFYSPKGEKIATEAVLENAKKIHAKRIQERHVKENNTQNHNWAIYVNPLGVDATVQVLHTRCTAAGYMWNPYYTQLVDPLNKELYEQECGPDHPLRCYVGDLSGHLGTINIGRRKRVFSDPNFPLVDKIHCIANVKKQYINNKPFDSHFDGKSTLSTIVTVCKEGLNEETYKNIVSFQIRQTEKSNIKFIENIVCIRDQIEFKSSIYSTPLNKVLHDETEHLSQLVGSKAAGYKENQLSEDSGISSERNSSETNLATPVQKLSTKATPTGISINVPRSKNTTTPHSLEFILNFIKFKINNLKTVFDNWKNSLVELACTVVCECMQTGTIEYEEIVHNFIGELLRDIWTDTELNHHTKWKRWLDIVKELLTFPSVCLQVFKFTTDILKLITPDLSKGSCNPLVAYKITMILNLFPIMAGTLNVFKKMDSSKKSQEVITVSKLWYDKFAPDVKANYYQNLYQRIETDIAPKLVEFLTIIIHKEPLISLVAKEALDWLEVFDIEMHESQDSLLHVRSQERV